MTTSIARMNPETLPDASMIGYSQISVVPPGPLAFVSGQVAQTRDGTPTPNSLSEQTALVIDNLTHALKVLDATPHDIAQMRIYVTDLNQDTLEISMTQIIRFLDGAQPSLTGVGVSALAGPDLKIEIEMVVSVTD
ncbi:MAG: RidA family protein [Pseudomonadota bacterium]